MTGYVRQSTAEIATGEVVLALPLNNEFNALQAAFHASTGHTHDGSTSNGPLINLTTSVTGILPTANGGTGTGTLTTVDNTIARFNGTGGVLQASSVVISDTWGLSGITTIDTTGNITMTKTVNARLILVSSTGGSTSFVTETGSGITYAADNTNVAGSSFHIWTVDGTQSMALNTTTLILSSNVAISFAGTGAATTRTNLGVAIGTDVQAFDSGLAALAAYNTNGILVQTANNTFAGRTLTGTAAELTVTNGDGVSGNPTISIPAAVTLTGKTLTGGTFASGAFNGTLGATTPSSVAATTISATETATLVAANLTGNLGLSKASPTITFTETVSGSVSTIFENGGQIIYSADTMNTVGSSFHIWRVDSAQKFAVGASSASFSAGVSLTASGGGSLTGTWTNLGTVTTIDINGGTIDGTAIGGATPAAGAFTTISATGDISQTKATPTFTQTDTGSGSVNSIQSSATLLFSVDGANAVASSAIQFNVDGAARMSLNATSLRMLNSITLRFATYTVATLPAGSVGDTVFATDCRVFNGAGTQEGAAAGTGGLVTYNGTAWKIVGTNVTAVA